ncbi:MAG: hypothetical protein B0W54_09910 [Cellvibrio sp. 79]|nr:MAG: hypothetical protein B0W54_09910 [Cellvibrio sp. 79]
MSGIKIKLIMLDTTKKQLDILGGSVAVIPLALDQHSGKKIFHGEFSRYDMVAGEINVLPTQGADDYLVVFPYDKNGAYDSIIVGSQGSSGGDVTYGNITVEWKISTDIGSSIDPDQEFYFIGGQIKLNATSGYTGSKIFDVGRNEEITSKGSKPYLSDTKGIHSYPIDVEVPGDSNTKISFCGTSTPTVTNNSPAGHAQKHLPSDIKTLKLRSVRKVEVIEDPAKASSGNVLVSHTRKVAKPTEPIAFFVHLLNSSKSIEFGAYQEFIKNVLCVDSSSETFESSYTTKLNRMKNEMFNFGVGSYELLKTATEIFLLLNGSITIEQGGSLKLPLHKNLDLGDYSRVPQGEWGALFGNYLGEHRKSYIQHIVDTALPDYSVPNKTKDPRFCTDILIRSRVNNPCFMELIWNYWHEEAMLVQTINAVSRRFQNLRAPGERDPLAHVEIDPLRPLNNILWGYVEEERDRLSIKRRAYEYQHQYGLELYGKAVSNLRPADTRSKFLEAFHNLLNKCADYFRAKQDTTVDPDGYPMLHAIQELNLILAHGAHNQFGDLAWTSRVEMLMQEWILSRPEIRDFLQSRVMVPHKEAWMPQVDTMKTLQGWSDVPVTHFRDLGVLGEQILLTIRWHNWYEVTNEDEAKGWADLLRPHIQSYIHAYRAVTGVDLSATDGVDFTMPSVLLRKRLATQHAPR